MQRLRHVTDRVSASYIKTWRRREMSIWNLPLTFYHRKFVDDKKLRTLGDLQGELAADNRPGWPLTGLRVGWTAVEEFCLWTEGSAFVWCRSAPGSVRRESTDADWERMNSRRDFFSLHRKHVEKSHFRTSHLVRCCWSRCNCSADDSCREPVDLEPCRQQAFSVQSK